MDKITPIIKYLGILGITLVLGFWSISYVFELSEKNNTAEVPEVTQPQNQAPLITPIETIKIELIKPSDKYTMMGDPYSKNNYDKMARRMALIGDFQIAKLNIKGSFTDNKKHFISLNVGSVSGVYNAVRQSSGLNIALTDESKGIFDKNNPINITIDLFGKQTMSTTQKEFLATREATKLVRLWDAIHPPTPSPSVTPILIAPFDKSGVFSGTIDSLEFEYKCKDWNDCQAVLCKNNVMDSVCINDNFGANAKNSWVKWYKNTQ
ncbi:MAG: hypothetical protein US86_C0015G0010 [Candidatus Daviesbacteria bacterium GW2011_GWA2_38_24]|uniref:Uncharacterized protein n=2 Tax=Patescibacteria group TaxID=1783273 RepID=A0A1F6YB28_9BACT|nr:MAG: hypothetical protein US86_C0015G0010 [Candidatus Daviesbacteria bacterium GW2011_GWA2_38_24]OGI80056.1 MAG: hypothetical protein A3D43_01475 [Candidatus Nomurabacteria bacterium RIFCSPHIGHO2_02_FULL_41_52]OGI85300.1 MAG: hypothetical protein A3F49_01195 [Candidatus Nomurabacteria bacterium RIFCSPHIGHO2_12_FULL_42_19]OGI94147.1 MAG: hypothetical protein A3A07_00925 [Candidatus Nomurabacteria bacterium RIFCSPLOWO2_01_FULL_41_52]OGI98969.1 MAG: hypothetical protein A3H56_00385 [Candidatus 